MALLESSWLHGVTSLRFFSTMHNVTSPFVLHLMQMLKLGRTHPCRHPRLYTWKPNSNSANLLFW